MLEQADAALIIGDPALHLDPETLPFTTLDLGSEWTGMTGLPMVFAVWAGRAGIIRPELEDVFTASCDFGLARLEEIARIAAPARGLSEALVLDYLRRNIIFKLDRRHYEGMRLFLEYAESIRATESLGKVSV
jgi:Predicted periplasmic solute-binding protein